MADILTCHSRKSTYANNTVNDFYSVSGSWYCAFRLNVTLSCLMQKSKFSESKLPKDNSEILQQFPVIFVKYYHIHQRNMILF